MKPIEFAGDSLARLRDFPPTARRAAGYQLDRFSAAWSRTIGSRCGPSVGAFRVIYLATLADRIVVLHAFQKKTQRTAKHDIELAANRLRELQKD